MDGGGTLRPCLEVILENPHTGKKVRCIGLIDTGADECAIPAGYAPLLGHNFEKGTKVKGIGTAGGETDAYAHTMIVNIPNFSTSEVSIHFMSGLGVVLLGVKNFLSNFVLTVDYKKKKFSLQKPKPKKK
jgi:predicted aspartyl protease